MSAGQTRRSFTEGNQMSYSSEQLEVIRARLAELQPQSRQGSTQHAVDALAKEIQDARRRGVSMDQIASVIVDGGVGAAKTTIKTYVKRSSAASSGNKATQRRAQARTAKRSDSGAPSDTDRQQQRQADGNSGRHQPGTFEVRRDSTDI